MLFKSKLQLVYAVGTVAVTIGIMMAIFLIGADLLLIILSGIGIAVFSLVFFYGFVRSYFYYVPVTIKGIRRGGSFSRENDFARRIMNYDNVTSVYELYYRNTKTRAPNLQDLEIGAKGKNYLELIELEDNVFVPAPPLTFKETETREIYEYDKETGKSKLVTRQIPLSRIVESSQQDLSWSVQEMEKAVKDMADKQSSWAKNAQMIGLIAIVVCAVVAMAIIFPAIQKIASQASTACAMNLEQTSKAITVLNDTCSRYVNGSYVIPQITNTTW